MTDRFTWDDGDIEVIHRTEKYSPDQPRDDHGRWTVGGVTGIGIGSPSRDYVRGVADAVAKELGHTGEIEVSDLPADQVPTFTLNDRTFKYAGAAHLDTGKITLYPAAIGTENAVGGLVAHEITHQKFNKFWNQYSAEQSEIAKLSSGLPRGESIVKADGSFADPANDAKYPRYSVMNKLMGEHDKMVKEDGVSEYSRDWWKAWHGGKAGTDQAFHETLAEIGRIHYDTGKPPGSPRWRKLYKAVMENK